MNPTNPTLLNINNVVNPILPTTQIMPSIDSSSHAHAKVEIKRTSIEIDQVFHFSKINKGW